MPVYEYQCKACHQEFEYQQRMSDPDKTTCEACGGALDRLISRTAFQLKGSGWYITDYARAGKSDSGTAAGGKSDDKTSSNDSKSETKTESSSESKTSTASESKAESKPPSASNS